MLSVVCASMWTLRNGDWGVQKWELVAFLSKFLSTLIFEIGLLIGTLVCLDYLVTDPRDSLVSCLSCTGTTGKGCRTWFMHGLWEIYILVLTLVKQWFYLMSCPPPPYECVEMRKFRLCLNFTFSLFSLNANE